jgi:hypothetical protein
LRPHRQEQEQHLYALGVWGDVGRGRVTWSEETYLKSICLSIVMAVTTRGLRPVERPWSSILEDMSAVVNSVSAAVPAPQQRIDSVM